MKNENTIVEWNNFRSFFKKKSGFDFDQFMKKIELSISPKDWHRVDNWEELEDLDVFKSINKYQKVAGDIHVVTEASYNDGLGVFFLNARDLKELVSHHLESYGECFFSGDVLIMDINSKKTWVFHHEGVFSYLEQWAFC